ncbi:MAG: nucleotidyltransferase family protein [Myxococcaceae bacterium]
MPTRRPELVEVVVALIDVFERSDLPYAFGGAIALSAWAEPRATVDIDLDAWVEADRLPALFELLERAGATIDRVAATASAAEQGMFEAWQGGIRIDVFVPSVPFYAEALSRRRRTRIADHETWALSPECLAVFKMLFFRPKDLVDVARLVAIGAAGFDRKFVERWLTDMVGADDPRLAAWFRLLGEADAVT